jgi:uncharacterized membrane protein YphA (DoxX/SURF4 family)
MKRIAKNRFGRSAFWIARILLGLVFIYAAIIKITAPQDFADSIAAYQILPFSVINVVAIGLPLFELVCGLLLIAGFALRLSLLGILAMLSVFTLAIGLGMLRGISLDCGCFGSHSWLDSNPSIALVRDLALLVIAVYLYRSCLENPQPDPAGVTEPRALS